jgi:Calcium-dependent channel, 7TM region, putative phosphate
VRPGEIVMAFFSPWLAHYRRKYINDSQPWRRREGMVFLYGFYYAQQLAIFSIVLVFASFVPIISITGFMFFCMRHIVDSYNLLTVNRKEIDSSTKMFQKILLTSQFAILLLQLCMMSYMAINNYMPCAALLALVFFLTVIATNKPLLDPLSDNLFNEIGQSELVQEVNKVVNPPLVVPLDEQLNET